MDIAGGLNSAETPVHANLFTDGVPKAGLGRTGAGGATSGEQQTQWSSGRLTLRQATPEGACQSRTAMASEPDEFMDAEGSYRS